MEYRWKGMKPLHLSLLVSSVGIIFLYVISMLIQPTPVSINDIEKFEGKYVIVKGMISSTFVTNNGNQLITLKNGKEKINIFSTKVTDADVGDVVTVEGRVERYKGELEIITEGKIETISKSTNVSLYRLSSDPEQYVDREINTTGYIYSMDGNILKVKDGGYLIEVIASPIDAEKLSVGDKISIRGFFLYDKKAFSYYILSTKVMKVV